MAESLEDAEFWLPSQFLSDHDQAVETGKNRASQLRMSFPTEFPYEFDSLSVNSALNSPVESVESSNETECSDEDEFFTRLTKRLAQSSLHESHKLAAPSFIHNKSEKCAVAGSPQSILSGIGSWSGRSTMSSNGSPNSPSQVSSPPTTPYGAEDTRDLIYAAAGQVARLKMNYEAANYIQNRVPLLPTRRPNYIPSVKNPNVTGLYSTHSLSQNLPYTAQFQQLKRDQILRPQSCFAWGRQGNMGISAHHHQSQIVRNSEYGNGRCANPVCLNQSGWPPLKAQHQNQQPKQSSSAVGGGVYVGRSGGRKECSGTGVFLPRRYTSHSVSHKKTGCPNILVPAKVVHALYLSYDGMDGPSQAPLHSSLTPGYATMVTLKDRRSMLPEKKAINHELRLPQEWTY